MRIILILLALSFGAAQAVPNSPAWRDKNRNDVTLPKPSVAEHGAPSKASSFDMGYCAASIVATQPRTAKRIMDEAIGRGQREEFYQGADAYVAAVSKDPVTAWTKGSRACTGYMLQPISFVKQDRVQGEKK